MASCRAFALGVQFRNVPRSQALQIFRSSQRSMLSSSTTPPPKPPPIPPPPPTKGPNFLHLTLLTFFCGGVAYVAMKPSSDEDEIFDKPPKFMEEIAPATILKNSRGWFSKQNKTFWWIFCGCQEERSVAAAADIDRTLEWNNQDRRLVTGENGTWALNVSTEYGECGYQLWSASGSTRYQILVIVSHAVSEHA